MTRNSLLLIFAYLLVTFGTVIVLIARGIQKSKAENEQWFFQIAVNLDYVGGTLLYDHDGKTVSAITGKLVAETEESKRVRNFERLINWIFQDATHCHDAYIKEFKNEH